jgi:membrane dipeptidase
MPETHSIVSAKATALHERALIVDGLTPFYTLDEPYTASLIAGGVSGALLSVVSDATWDATLQRTETALEKIEKSPHLMLATKAADFKTAKAQGKVAMMLVTQAVDMLGNDLKRVGIMHRLGFRILGVCYTFANLVGDGCGELRNAGLSFLGQELIDAVNELPMMLDVSHAGHQTSLEVVELARRPCVTHANAYAVVANDRNKKDAVLNIVAAKGGVIGLCGLPRSVHHPEPTLAHMLDHLDHLTKTMGTAHVGLGLDYVEGFRKAGIVLPQSRRNRTLRPDIFGSVDDFLNQEYPRGLEDIRKLRNLTQGMLDRGYGEQSIMDVLGASWLRAIEANIG